jgi:hypothetical protein
VTLQGGVTAVPLLLFVSLLPLLDEGLSSGMHEVRQTRTLAGHGPVGALGFGTQRRKSFIRRHRRSKLPLQRRRLEGRSDDGVLSFGAAST